MWDWEKGEALPHECEYGPVKIGAKGRTFIRCVHCSQFPPQPKKKKVKRKKKEAVESPETEVEHQHGLI